MMSKRQRAIQLARQPGHNWAAHASDLHRLGLQSAKLSSCCDCAPPLREGRLDFDCGDHHQNANRLRRKRRGKITSAVRLDGGLNLVTLHRGGSNCQARHGARLGFQVSDVEPARRADLVSSRTPSRMERDLVKLTPKGGTNLKTTCHDARRSGEFIDATPAPKVELLDSEVAKTISGNQEADLAGHKKSISAHFQESFYFKRPNWQTGLTERELESDLDDEDDESEPNLKASTLERSPKRPSSREKTQVECIAERRKSFKESRTNEDILLSSSESSEKLAGRIKGLTGADGELESNSRPARQQRRVSIVDTAKMIILSQDVDELASGRKPKLASVAPKERRRPSLFAYLPFTSSSQSFGTSLTSSSFNFEPDQRSSMSLFRASSSDKPSQMGCRSRATYDNLNVRNLKFMLARNLVATLIGAYILISLLILIALMLPYLFETGRSHNLNSQLDNQNHRGHQLNWRLREENQLVMSRESRDAQARELDHLRNDLTRERIELQRQLDLASIPAGPETKGRRQRPRPKQPRPVDAVARGTGDLLEYWREEQPGQCQPLTLPFCSRSIQSMMPPSVVNLMNQLKAPGGKGSNFQMSYEWTSLPNQLMSAHQPQVERFLNKYEPLVDVKCYPLMPLFLCSIFAPKCVKTNSSLVIEQQRQQQQRQEVRISDRREFNPRQQKRSQPHSGIGFVRNLLDLLVPKLNDSEPVGRSRVRLVPPCRSICKEALRRCTFFLEVLSLELLDDVDCEQLPDSSDDNVCVGHNENQILGLAAESRKCPEEDFRCNDGECISKKWRCDGFADCRDKSDEDKCSGCDPQSQFYCGPILSNVTQPPRRLDVCIGKRLVCDGNIDCRDGRDERLCLRLASAINSTSGPNISNVAQLPRRLEVWNETTSSWTSVCGAKWRAMPMSHEACQALGYSRANETLILLSGQTPEFGPPPSRTRRAPPALDHHISWRRQTLESDEVTFESTPPVDLDPSGSTESSDDIQTLGGLMRLGVQVGCDEARPSSSVYLSCHNFQCGASATSHLSRLDLEANSEELSSEWHSEGTTRVDTVISSKQSAAVVAGKSKPASSLRSVRAVDSSNPLKRQHGVGGEEDGGNQLSLYEDDDDDDDNSMGQSPSTPISSRLVVGGIESLPGEFPYLAALYGGPDEVFFCGGVLISSHWLLTAAHCVGNRTRPDGWMVMVGVTRRIASPAFVRKLKVRRIIKHQQFNVGAPLNNDIALILLDQLGDFNQYLGPICLPLADPKLDPDNSKDCVVVGFGKSHFSQEANYLHVAHFVHVPIIHKPVCAEWYASQQVTLTEGMLCAGYLDGKKDACQGDSGSGLFCRRPNSKYFFLAGLVSFGVQCAKPKLPGVYSSIPFYLDWINKTTRENGFPME